MISDFLGLYDENLDLFMSLMIFFLEFLIIFFINMLLFYNIKD